MTMAPCIPIKVKKSHHAVYRRTFLICRGKVRYIKEKGIFLKNKKRGVLDIIEQL